MKTITANQIFFSDDSQGAYGIEQLKNIVHLANDLYDLADRVYFDDQKIDFSDLSDVVGLGPGIIQGVTRAIQGGRDIGKELTDLSESEKAELLNLANVRLKDPSYMKVVDGILQIIDGISEKVNPSNPVG